MNLSSFMFQCPMAARAASGDWSGVRTLLKIDQEEHQTTPILEVGHGFADRRTRGPRMVLDLHRVP